MLRIALKTWTGCIPVTLSVIFYKMPSVALFVATFLSHFVVLMVTPAFRRNENVWMFIMVAFSVISPNIYIIRAVNYTDIFISNLGILNVVRGIIFYIALFSMEEVIMGVLTRIIWRKQNNSVV